MKERRISIHINGISPLVMNNPGLMEGEDKGRDKLQWEREHIAEKLYTNASGDLVIPSAALKASIVYGAKFTSLKPKGASFKSYGPLIEAAFFIEDDILLNVTKKNITEWVQIVNLNPSKGPRGPKGPRCRPLFQVPWCGDTTAVLVDDALKLEDMIEIIDAAGRLCGLLDGRKRGMGRYEATVEVVK